MTNTSAQTRFQYGGCETGASHSRVMTSDWAAAEITSIVLAVPVPGVTVGGLKRAVAVEGKPAILKPIEEPNPSARLGVIVIGTWTEDPAETLAVAGRLTEKSSIAS